MSYTQVGACPKCGAPIYSPSSWMSITPPPSQYTCNCAGGGQAVQIVTAPSTTFINPFLGGFDISQKPPKEPDYNPSLKARPRLTDVHERVAPDETTP